jgi:hypothetical protein
MKFLTVQKPKVAERDILVHLQRAYGLPGSLKTIEFVRAYYKIQDPAVRKRLAELTKAVAKIG